MNRRKRRAAALAAPRRLLAPAPPPHLPKHQPKKLSGKWKQHFSTI